ncbi:type II toxin-antitoxin system Phd/YefM family antitoxin [Holosporaceae bacterium 'Namur']|nr:type II toxin-antitoxin system Phd/YefM family antitoxin [Holosporaceae bacterium 'Namur']
MDKHLPISEFKAHCYEILENVQGQHQSFIISKRGKPIARVIPIDNNNTKLAGSFKGKCNIIGDIITPVDITWDAEG